MGGVQGPLSPGEGMETGGVGETTSSRPPPGGNAGKTAASNFEFQNLKLFALATRIDQIPFVSLLHCLQGEKQTYNLEFTRKEQSDSERSYF